MDYKDVQRLLAAAGYYKGPIDGRVNEAMERSVRIILERHHAITPITTENSLRRQMIAAAQLILHFAGHQVGAIDGYDGNQTNGALLEWDHEQAYQSPLVLDMDRVPMRVTSASSKFPRQAEIIQFYGTPGVNGSAQTQLVKVDVPYRVIIEYAPNLTRKQLNLHSKCADSYANIMDDVLRFYGESRIHEYGLDQFAGDYVPRLMRGSKTTWSMHAYGCAIDWDSNRNGLTTRAPYAQFSRPEYKDFLDIHESHGWVSLGRAIGRDYMHFQAARL